MLGVDKNDVVCYFHCTSTNAMSLIEEAAQLSRLDFSAIPVMCDDPAWFEVELISVIFQRLDRCLLVRLYETAGPRTGDP